MAGDKNEENTSGQLNAQKIPTQPDSQPHTQLDLLRERIARFCEERDWDQFHEIKDLAIGVSTEAAELLELFRFQTREQCEALLTEPAKREQIEDELADVFFFLLRIAGRYQIDLEQSLKRKMAKNEAKYPVEKARGSNRKYDEF